MKSVIAAVIFASVALAGCSSSVDNPPDVNPPNLTSGNNNPGGGTPPPAAAPTAALFQPAQGVLPYPTDIWFSGSTDGTLNIPANALIPSGAALNALDGFSTNAVIRARFGIALNPASLNASTVRVIQISTDNATKAPGPPFAPLVLGTDFEVGLAPDAGVGATILEIRPLRPLEASTSLGARGVGYLVLLTNGITTAGGAPTTPDADYAAFKAALAGGSTCPGITGQANLLCQLTGAHLQIGGAFGVNPASVVLSFSFTTQSTRDALAEVAAIATAQPIAAQNTGIDTAELGALSNPPIQGLRGVADVYVGTLSVPYYLSRTQPTTGSWRAAPFALDSTSRFVTRFNPRPVATEQLTIPLLATVPNATSAGGTGGTKPANGWPVLIFQHGITRNRTDMIGVADTFADAGFVVVAIDQPLHGITDPANALYARNPPPATGSIERTFDLDLADNDPNTPPNAPGPDGVIDRSGAHFIQLTSLLTSRDNSRQAAADLITLTRSLADLDLDADGTADIDVTRVHFLGHSLGGIVGTSYLAVIGPNEVVTATLAMPGGGVARLLRDSASFGPAIQQGLSAQGLTPGTTLLEQFFRDAQTAIDASDPINFIAEAAAARPTLILQVVGDGDTVPSDTVVPNTATQRLIAASRIRPFTKVSPPPVFTPPPGGTPLVDGSGHRAFTNFTQGNHGSIIDPTGSLATTTEMQVEVASFVSGSPPALPPGTLILRGNPAVIQP